MLGDSVRRRQPRRRPPQARGASKERRLLKPLLVGVPLALVLPFLIGYLIMVYAVFPPTEVSGVGVPVPDLVGGSAGDAQRALAAAGLGELEAEDLPHPSAPAGQVLAQSPLPGQQLRPAASVRVALSSGPPRVVVPDVLGFSVGRASSMLRRSGFDVRRTEQESRAPEGRVIRTDPAPGQERRLPAAVTLVVSSGPAEPEPEPQDTVPSDTIPADSPPARR